MKSIFERLVESKQVALKQKTLFVAHLWIYCFIGFTTTLVSLNFISLNHHHPTNLFYLYFLFNASLFIGAVFHSNISRRLPLKWILVTCLLLISCSMCILPHTQHFIALSVVLVVLGAGLGVGLCSVTGSFTIIFRQTTYLLVQLLHIMGAAGSVTAVMFYQSAPQGFRNSTTLLISPRIPNIEKFNMNPSLRSEYIYYISAALQAPVIIALLRVELSSVVKTMISIRRTDYDDIDQITNHQSLTQQSDVHTFKLVLLCSFFACISNIMYNLFPFLILAQPDASFFHYQLFSIFFMWGRTISMFTSDHMEPYVLVGLSILGCGVGCCCLASSTYFITIGSILFGIFLSPILPALIIYINHVLSLKSTNTFTLLCGHTAGNIAFPLLLTVATSRLFIALNLVAILILVVILVWILSLHAQIERMQASQSGLNHFVSRFLSGESLLKRTRSIRPLISRLRPNSYRRFANRRGCSPRSPSPCDPSVELTVQSNTKERNPTILLIPTQV